MRALSLLIFLLIFTNIIEARTITDDFGRVVTIPDRITKIYSPSPPQTITISAFDPALVAGLNFPFKPDQKPYVGVAASRPVVGGYFGQGNTPNLEVLASLKPDVILMWGNATGSDIQLKQLSTLGIPVLMVRNESINDLIGEFDLLGRLTGNTKRARELIAYTKETLGLVQSLQSKVNARKDVRYYFAEGMDGMSSECEGSRHLEPFTYAGAKDAINCKSISNYGMEKMSMEQIILADPDVIIAMEPSFVESIATNPKWKMLRAVKTGHVLTVPNVPFNYISRPPSLARLMGIRWLIHAFYPDLIKPIDQERRRFEKLFFPSYRG
jgi:iron complex transport system substrate-binding protein